MFRMNVLTSTPMSQMSHIYGPHTGERDRPGPNSVMSDAEPTYKMAPVHGPDMGDKDDGDSPKPSSAYSDMRKDIAMPLPDKPNPSSRPVSGRNDRLSNLLPDQRKRVQLAAISASKTKRETVSRASEEANIYFTESGAEILTPVSSKPQSRRSDRASTLPSHQHKHDQRMNAVPVLSSKPKSGRRDGAITFSGDTDKRLPDKRGAVSASPSKLDSTSRDAALTFPEVPDQPTKVFPRTPDQPKQVSPVSISSSKSDFARDGASTFHGNPNKHVQDREVSAMSSIKNKHTSGKSDRASKISDDLNNFLDEGDLAATRSPPNQPKQVRPISISSSKSDFARGHGTSISHGEPDKYAQDKGVSAMSSVKNMRNSGKSDRASKISDDLINVLDEGDLAAVRSSSKQSSVLSIVEAKQSVESYKHIPGSSIVETKSTKPGSFYSSPGPRGSVPRTPRSDQSGLSSISPGRQSKYQPGAVAKSTPTKQNPARKVQTRNEQEPIQTATFKVDNTLTQCKVCLNTLHLPKMLPCLHNVCKECLNDHILEKVKKNLKGGHVASFPCPVCRRHVPTPEITADPDKWAAMFPDNFFLGCYARILNISNKPASCDPCSRRNETNPASFWCRDCAEFQCTTCSNTHSGFIVFLDHFVMNIERVKQSPREALPKYEPCKEHKEKVRLYCKDHRAPCCSECMVTRHRRCDNITAIEEEFRLHKTKGEFDRLAHVLEQYESISKGITDQRKQISENLTSRHQDILNKITEMRKMVMNKLEEIENQLLKDFNTFHKNEMEKLNRQTEDTDNLSKMISNASAQVNCVQQNGCESQVMCLVTKVVRECETYEERLKEVQKHLEYISYGFKPEKTVDEFVQALHQLGTINVERAIGKSHAVVANPFRMGTAKETARFRVFLAGDKGRCGIMGGVYLPDNRILLADFDNYKLKMFRENGELLTKLNLKNKPSDITMINQETFAVTYPSSNSLQFIHLSGNSMNEGDLVEMSRMYHGLSCDGDKIYLISSSGVTVCSVDGSEICSFRTTSNGKPMFDAPAYIKATTDAIFVTDYKKNALSALAPDGHLMYTYTARDLVYPLGLDLDHDGNIYVCCKNSSNIHLLSPDGTRIRVILTGRDGIENPLALRFHKNKNRFFISESKAQHKDYIRIYEMH